MDVRKDLLTVGLEKGYLMFLTKEGKQYIRYVPADKEYSFNDPEEQVRAEIYVELIENYGYPPDKIKLEEYPPVREGARPSDIVIYDPDNFPFIVIELKKKDATQQEIQTGIRELFGNANLFGVRWALFDCRVERRAYFSLSNFSLPNEPNLRKSNIPIAYGLPERFTYGHGVGVQLSPFGEIIQFQKLIKKCHKIIRDNENLSPISAFPVISRIIYTKIYDELNTPEEHYYGFQIGEGEDIISVASRIAALYKKASSIEPDVFSPLLGVEKAETLYQIVQLLQPFTLYNSPYDIKGEAYQSFLGKLMREEAGQYFTPREVVEPTVAILSPSDNEKIIDPCCGTGGFLIYAYKYLREKIRKHYKDEKTRIRKEYDVAHYNVFGIEVDVNVAEACVAGMLLEDDAHGHIAITDALSDWDNQMFLKKNIEKEKFNVLMTNPPFGKKNRLEEHKEKFVLGQKFKTPPLEALVLERSLELLAPGGRAGFVIPDINLTTKEILDFLWENTIILGVVSLPSETFNPYGSQAKTSVIFFTKKKQPDERTEKIFMASVKQIGYDATGRKKGDGRNGYSDVVVYFQKFLRGETLESVVDEKFSIFVLEGENIEKAKENLKVDNYLLRKSQNGKNFVKLNEIAQILRGFTPGWHDYTESGIPILKVRNLTNRFIDFNFEKRGYVSEEIYNGHPDAHVKQYDILLTASAHKPEYIAKKIDILDILPFEKCMAVAELMIIRPDSDKIDPFYLLAVLRIKEINDQFRSCIRGTTAHIYPEDIGEKVYIPRLSPNDEKEIAESLKKALKKYREFEKELSQHIAIMQKSLIESLTTCGKE
ncbi:N-6 DNA methylase [Thermoanaerobacterium thermosaccharolyticum]|uniref:N-6 DNA methylase n=1 Tax=Thermoanaerobacterium thermosaccharolyticum TaxID=1517 RepID=UPI003D28E42E